MLQKLSKEASNAVHKYAFILGIGTYLDCYIAADDRDILAVG